MENSKNSWLCMNEGPGGGKCEKQCAECKNHFADQNFSKQNINIKYELPVYPHPFVGNPKNIR